MTFPPKELAARIPGLLLGGSAGAGITIALVLAEKEPKLLIETFARWGAPSLIGLGAAGVTGDGGGWKFEPSS